MRATLTDGWIELSSCKEYIGTGGRMLYRTPCGHWLLMERDTYHRVDQATAHSILEAWGYYPRNIEAGQLTAL